jgi:hypothetical protein
MIGMLIGALAPRLGERAARPVAWIIVIIGAILLLWGAKALYDASVIDKHEDKVEASAAKADRKADQIIAEQAERDLNRRQQEAEQLTEVMKRAATDPQIPDDRERAIAFHRCLSLQQAARENGSKPPRCV